MTLDIKDAGKQLTRDEVVALENEVGAPLPRQYARFLMANNGGVPRPNIVDINGLPTSPTDVQEFFGLGLDIETSNLTWYIREVPERIPMGFLAIACDSGGNLFCISLAGEDAGQVSYLDLTQERSSMYLIAADFDGFLARIRS